MAEYTLNIFLSTSGYCGAWTLPQGKEVSSHSQFLATTSPFATKRILELLSDAKGSTIRVTTEEPNPEKDYRRLTKFDFSQFVSSLRREKPDITFVVDTDQKYL